MTGGQHPACFPTNLMVTSNSSWSNPNSFWHWAMTNIMVNCLRKSLIRFLWKLNALTCFVASRWGGKDFCKPVAASRCFERHVLISGIFTLEKNIEFLKYQLIIIIPNANWSLLFQTELFLFGLSYCVNSIGVLESVGLVAQRSSPWGW